MSTVPDDADRLFAEYHDEMHAAAREREIARAEATHTNEVIVEEAANILLTVLHDIDAEHDTRIQAARTAYIDAINNLHNPED